MYALGRPDGMVTVMEGRPGAWHLCRGWSAFEGTRTACGSKLGDGKAYRHVYPGELDTAITCYACRGTKRAREIFGGYIGRLPTGPTS